MNRVADVRGKELDPESIRALYETEFLNVEDTLALLSFNEIPDHAKGLTTWRSKVRYLGEEREITGTGTRSHRGLRQQPGHARHRGSEGRVLPRGCPLVGLRRPRCRLCAGSRPGEARSPGAPAPTRASRRPACARSSLRSTGASPRAARMKCSIGSRCPSFPPCPPTSPQAASSRASLDAIFVTGDAYVDHASFGVGPPGQAPRGRGLSGRDHRQARPRRRRGLPPSGPARARLPRDGRGPRLDGLLVYRQPQAALRGRLRARRQARALPARRRHDRPGRRRAAPRRGPTGPSSPTPPSAARPSRA